MAANRALQEVIDAIVAAEPEVAWSIAVTAADGRPLASAAAERSLRTASVGKVLLLTELAALLESGDEDEDALLPRTGVPEVGGSGFLQYLKLAEISVHDLAVLVAAASDNFATNLLLARVGLERVRQRAGSLGLSATALHDQVRDDRGPDDPSTLSTGSAAELSRLMADAANDRLVSPFVSRRIRAWLSNNADTSMVASAFDLDPLEHNASATPTADIVLFNKTGTDEGVRADVGWIAVANGNPECEAIAYCAIANWSRNTVDATAAVLAGMRRLGEELRHRLSDLDS